VDGPKNELQANIENDAVTVPLIGSVSFMPTTKAEAVAASLALARRQGKNKFITLSNVWCVALAEMDSRYREVLASASYTFADGRPITWLMNSIGRKTSQIRGADYFLEVLSLSAQTGLRHAFLGSTEEDLSKMLTRIQVEIPSLVIGGTWAPPFQEISESFIVEVVEFIDKSKPDIVWIGMGTPKQDFLAYELSHRRPVLSIGVGAVFSFMAGKNREAPVVIQKMGMEWLFRLFQEPRRLAKRYLIGNSMFIVIAFKTLWFYLKSDSNFTKRITIFLSKYSRRQK